MTDLLHGDMWVNRTDHGSQVMQQHLVYLIYHSAKQALWETQNSLFPQEHVLDFKGFHFDKQLNHLLCAGSSYRVSIFGEPSFRLRISAHFSMNPSSLNVWCFFEAEMKEDSSASLFCCITKRSLSVSAATCLQYAALWVIALWIVCGVCVCVCMHVRLCLSAVLGKIRSAVGSAQLLMSQKFQQFRELCEENLVCVTSSSACSPSPTPSSRHWHHPAQIILTGRASAHLLCI